LECPGDLVYTEEYGKCVDYNMAFECKLFKVFFPNNLALHVIRGGEWGNPNVEKSPSLENWTDGVQNWMDLGCKIGWIWSATFFQLFPPPLWYIL